MRAHLEGCSACAEDHETLRAMLDEQGAESSSPAYFLNEMTCWIPVGRFEYGEVTRGRGP